MKNNIKLTVNEKKIKEKTSNITKTYMLQIS